uniref:Uncharacterized protein n=1 Tax=Arundo donax TaxID=35708 RepID=A0A0A9GKY3_ARUDO
MFLLVSWLSDILTEPG